jgi:thiosulfate dehydrogenase
MRSFLGGVVVTLLALFGGTYLVINRGWIAVGADNPPSAMERRIAHMATNAHVARVAPKQENPVQPTIANLIEGARNYEQRCALCHGGAAHRISPLRTKFSPPVPQIVNRVPRDDDGSLWWMTKHGIRLTGMPAWDGILSDDQMWGIIAFLKRSDKLPPEVQAEWQKAAARMAAIGGDEKAGSQGSEPQGRGATKG